MPNDAATSTPSPQSPAVRTRRSRLERARRLRDLSRLRGSFRRRTAALNLPRSTVQGWLHATTDSLPRSFRPFFASLHGLVFLHRLVLAVLFVFGLQAGVGAARLR